MQEILKAFSFETQIAFLKTSQKLSPWAWKTH